MLTMMCCQCNDTPNGCHTWGGCKGFIKVNVILLSINFCNKPRFVVSSTPPSTLQPTLYPSCHHKAKLPDIKRHFLEYRIILFLQSTHLPLIIFVCFFFIIIANHRMIHIRARYIMRIFACPTRRKEVANLLSHNVYTSHFGMALDDYMVSSIAWRTIA